MPSSPAMRCSPGREPRADNHKRGRSLESGIIPVKQRDDDLALFNEVQSKERDTFLLQANDDIEDIFTNELLNFSDYKLGINIPARGESSDLLHADDEKNDYEWLITPPETPLFSSLDDEAPKVNLARRGRPRTQPILISRSLTLEKSHRSSRGSESPNRVSVSPRSHNSTFEGRGQASSAASASPPTIFKPTTRSSPPSHKPVTPLKRASTRTLPRRLNTRSNGYTSSRGSRGNSPSPKVKAWQSTIPGFSTEVPPNLRTSLSDRPACYVRGSSPASRNSRQSMSPTASRSSCSKGSVGSSAEDDLESLSSVLVGSVQRSNSRKVGGFQNNRGSISKKSSTMVSSSSAPKRSFDLALRQMDHKRSPQNMFRPLLSSVPSSTFHGAISGSPHHNTLNSSVTTSSNASSGLGIVGAHDPKASQGDDATSRYIKMQDHHDVNDEVFVIEKDDDALDDSRNLGDHDPANFTVSLTFDDINSQKSLLICSNCGCGYSPVGLENNSILCADCLESYSHLTIVDPITSVTVSVSGTEATAQVNPQVDIVEVIERSGQHDNSVNDGQSTICDFLSESSLSRSRSEECEPEQVNQDTVDFSNLKVESLEGPKQDNQDTVAFSNSKVESLEGAVGISILLKRSSSSIKGPVVRNTNFSASSISYDDFSYVRDSTNSMRSVSATSSVDFGGVNRQPDARYHRQLSSTKSETEYYKFDLNAKHHRSASSLSGTSSHAFRPSSRGTSTLDSFGRGFQENNKENAIFTPENDIENNLQTTLSQTHVDSGESLLSDSSNVEDYRKAEDLGPDDISALQTSTFAKDKTNVAEVPLDAISESECDPSPAKCDASQSSTSSIEEFQENMVSTENHDTNDHTTSNIGESVVLVGQERGLKGRSLTLEEATDTILFCSSIVHNLAHNAATIAVEKENQFDMLNDNNTSWPLIPATRKSDLNALELQSENTTTKRSSKSQRSKHKKEVETDTTKAPIPTESDGKTDQLKTRIVGIRDSNNGESKKPPMLESKCNCTIM